MNSHPMGESKITTTMTGFLTDEKFRRYWLWGSLLLVAVKALPMLRFPLGGDHAVFLTLGDCILDGGVLYSDCWDTKSPGIFFLFALIAKVFGVTMWGMRVVDILWLLLSAYLVFRFAERYLGPAAAAVGAVVHAFWYVDFGYWYTAQTESFLMVFVLLGYLVAVREKGSKKVNLAGAGALMAVAFWFKYNNVAFIPLAIVIPYLNPEPSSEENPRPIFRIGFREWLRHAIYFSAGYAAMIFGVLGYFWIAGGLPDLFQAVFEVVPRYAAMGYAAKNNYPVDMIVTLKEIFGAWTEAALAVGLLVAWRTADLRRFCPVFWAAMIGLASAALQVRMHPYYLQTCLPFLAMIWGYLAVKGFEGFSWLASRLAQRGMRTAQRLIWASFIVLLAGQIAPNLFVLREEYKAFSAWARDPKVFYLSYPSRFLISHLRLQLRLIDFLKENSKPEDKIFFWGFQPLVYFMSERKSPSRFISNMPLVAAWSVPEWRDEVVEDLKNSPPKFFIVGRDDELPSILYIPYDSEHALAAFPQLAGFVAENYYPVYDLGVFIVYQRMQLPEN